MPADGDDLKITRQEEIALKSSIPTDLKRQLVELLKELYIISDSFTGKIVINFGQGGITEIERVEKIR